MKGFLIGFLAGIVALGLARFLFTPWEEPTHHHANWAVFVNGERLDLTSDRYMQPVEACAGEQLLPSSRVHMHDHDGDVVHVHDTGVTWGHFLANLGWGIGDDYLILESGSRYFEDEDRTLKFIVNGFEVSGVRDRLIHSGDRLLISYGPESAADAMRTQFPRVGSSAEEFNERDDPSGCAGVGQLTAWKRVGRAFWD